MIRNIKQAKDLVKLYSEIIKDDGLHLTGTDYPSLLLTILTGFSSHACPLCEAVRGEDHKPVCVECVWAARVGTKKGEMLFCNNENYFKIVGSRTSEEAYSLLEKRIEMLSEAIACSERMVQECSE